MALWPSGDTVKPDGLATCQTFSAVSGVVAAIEGILVTALNSAKRLIVLVNFIVYRPANPEVGFSIGEAAACWQPIPSDLGLIAVTTGLMRLLSLLLRGIFENHLYSCLY